MNREQLEAKALESVCPCWHWTLAGAIEETSDEELEAVIADSTAYHYREQVENPISDEDFLEELRECPSWQEPAA